MSSVPHSDVVGTTTLSILLCALTLLASFTASRLGLRFGPSLFPPALYMLCTGAIVRMCVSDTHVLQKALQLSAPPLSMALAAAGLEIGSHLTPSRVGPLFPHLILFALVFFPILFVGMLLLFRGLYAWLWWPSSISSTFPLPSLWGFSALFASISMEHSSVVCLATLQRTRASGVYSVFILTVAAMQDGVALLLFRLCDVFLHHAGEVRVGVRSVCVTFAATLTSAAAMAWVLFPLLSIPLQTRERLEWAETEKSLPTTPIHSQKGIGAWRVDALSRWGCSWVRTRLVPFVWRAWRWLGLCAALTLVSWWTPSELLLSAVGAGGVVFAPSRRAGLESAVHEWRGALRVVLFGFMGFHTPFPNAHSLTETTTVSVSVVLLSGVGVGLGRLGLLALAAFAGLTASGPLEHIPFPQTHSNPSPRCPKALGEDGGSPICCVHRFITPNTDEPRRGSFVTARRVLGLALMTQMALALAMVREAVGRYDPQTGHATRSPAIWPIAWAYSVSVGVSMVLGPLLCGWVLRSIGEVEQTGMRGCVELGEA